MKKWILNSRTFYVGLLVAVLAALNAIQPLITDPKVLSIIGAAVGIITIVLRLVTGQPVSMHPPEE